MVRFVNNAGRGLLLLSLLLLLSCGGAEVAQDFQVDLFDGRQFTLSEQYEDNVVVVNFWYPSCAPCREEMPEFQRAWEELQGEQVRFLGLFVPLGFDTEHSARAFVDELGLTFDFATDRGGSISSAYQIEFYPTTWFIDRGGRVATTHAGALDVERITAEVRKLMDE